METMTALDDLGGLSTDGKGLPDADVPAAEALVAAMAGWHAADLAAYRESVLAEARRFGRPPRGFLAVELAALARVEAPPG